MPTRAPSPSSFRTPLILLAFSLSALADLPSCDQSGDGSGSVTFAKNDAWWISVEDHGDKPATGLALHFRGENLVGGSFWLWEGYDERPTRNSKKCLVLDMHSPKRTASGWEADLQPNIAEATQLAGTCSIKFNGQRLGHSPATVFFKFAHLDEEHELKLTRVEPAMLK